MLPHSSVFLHHAPLAALAGYSLYISHGVASLLWPLTGTTTSVHFVMALFKVSIIRQQYLLLAFETIACVALLVMLVQSCEVVLIF